MPIAKDTPQEYEPNEQELAAALESLTGWVLLEQQRGTDGRLLRCAMLLQAAAFYHEEVRDPDGYGPKPWNLGASFRGIEKRWATRFGKLAKLALEATVLAVKQEAREAWARGHEPKSKQNHQTGTTTTIGTAQALGMPDTHQWYAQCETHETHRGTDSHIDAEALAAAPAGWCDDCAKLLQQKNRPKVLMPEGAAFGICCECSEARALMRKSPFIRIHNAEFGGQCRGSRRVPFRLCIGRGNTLGVPDTLQRAFDEFAEDYKQRGTYPRGG